VSKKQIIYSSVWAAALVYFLVASLIVGMLAIIGVQYILDEKPEVFDNLAQIYVTPEMVGTMLWVHPTLVLVLLTSLLFIDVKFNKGIFKSKKKTESVEVIAKKLPRFRCNCNLEFEYGTVEMDEHRKQEHWKGFWLIE